ncbi:MAG: hypothetical protein ACPG8W_00535 [Candidatus Promineifilaceae bacterium]
MKKRWITICLLLLMFALPTAIAFADGGHGNEDTAADTHAEEDDEHNEGAAASFALLPLVLGISAGGAVSGGTYASDKKRMTSLQLGVAGLTVATGVQHLLIGFNGDTLLLLNGLGYLALAAAMLLPLGLPDGVQRLLPIILGVYTLATIIGYFALHTPAQYSTLGLANKAMEVALIILVGMMLGQRSAEA